MRAIIVRCKKFESREEESRSRIRASILGEGDPGVPEDNETSLVGRNFVKLKRYELPRREENSDQVPKGGGREREVEEREGAAAAAAAVNANCKLRKTRDGIYGTEFRW